ncbi:hypothetical protein [Kitasatospora sp. NPDC088134]|uniref:hypothetical protein n=1 Tax=Kitasatospora sp. NPDC088134 TaxID=3364071 RepID=UPI00382B22AA
MTRPAPQEPAAHDLTALPGVRRWTMRVAADLAAGHSCLLILPTTAAAHAEDLLNAVLGSRSDWLRVPPPGTEPADTEPAGPEDDPPPLWSGQPPILHDLDDGDFVVGLMTAAFGAQAALTPLPPPPPPRTGPAHTNSIEARLESLLPARTSGNDPADDVYRRLTADHADGRTYVLNAAAEDDPDALARLLLRLPATVKAAGLQPHRRPRLLVVATADRLPATAPDDLPRNDVAVHWWWGTLGRLDTASVTAVSRPQRARASTGLAPAGDTHIAEAVIQATIVEVCGPHLALAATLATCWDGRPETLHAALATTCRAHPAPPGTQHPPAHRIGALAHQPPDALREQWNNGTIDAWDGHLRPHPSLLCAGSDHTALHKLLWVAHSRTLLPLIDDAREALAAQVLPTSTLGDDELLHLYGPETAPGTTSSTHDRLHAIELGKMLSAKTRGVLRFDPPQTSALHTLRNARNLLSHRRHLPGTTLDLLLPKLSP